MAVYEIIELVGKRSGLGARRMDDDGDSKAGQGFIVVVHNAELDCSGSALLQTINCLCLNILT